jgi:predicted extracellular nuclease
MRFPLFLLTLVLLQLSPLQAQHYRIAFWNVENLYDTINDPAINDEEFLPGAKNAWTSARYVTKLNNLADVILDMNAGKGPSILGMAEVENRKVLEDLTTKTKLKKQKYGIVHHNSRDKRGIDVALIYKKKDFRVLTSYTVPVAGWADTAYPTRDILLVKGILGKTDTLFVIVNHWPSRRGGEQESGPKRLLAAKTLQRLCDSLKAINAGSRIIALGDFNDEPTDASLKTVVSLQNKMDSIKNSGDGTHYYKKEKSVLDQILVSQTLNGGTTLKCGTAYIFKQDRLFAEVYKGDGPSPKRTWAGSRYIGGYSDHLPVYIDIHRIAVKGTK